MTSEPKETPEKNRPGKTGAIAAVTTASKSSLMASRSARLSILPEDSHSLKLGRYPVSRGFKKKLDGAHARSLLPPKILPRVIIITEHARVEEREGVSRLQFPDSYK